jgi:tetratricopeptide (TPR) repeat protein
MSEISSKTRTQLRIAHLPGSNPIAFQIVRLSDGKTTTPSSPVSPVGFPVEGRPNSDLLRELRWYLETFLEYPFPPVTDHADRVLKSLRDWGQQAFSTFFENRSAGRMFDAAVAEDYSDLYLQIASDDPRVLAWPWEALHDPEVGWLAQTCQIERRLNSVPDPKPLRGDLPKDQVNILLIVARPYGSRDVRFRSIARPLVDLIERDRLPAHVELLRPPTFDQLRQHLHEHPGFYHILHFDGHGAYGIPHQPGDGFTLQSPEGTLVFETDSGEPDPIPAEKLSVLLKEHALPGVVLNACQSAMVDADSKDPFASVATTLLRSGMRDVVAMAYSLYVSGAQQFLPSFYRRLFETGDMAAATRAGRQQMWRNDKRTSPRGDFPLQDWLLPILYRQAPINFSFAAGSSKATERRASQLPEELQRTNDPYGFVGRDSAILELERALRRAPAGILIQGLGGVGKTTLARGFLQWLDSTNGLGNGAFWLSFQEIRSAEYVFNRLGEAIFGSEFAAVPLDKKIETLARIFKENRFIIVWDNFESAAGITGTAITANLQQEDRQLLVSFLDELRGGATKIIITSRSTEDWLGPQRRFLLPLGGLDREERWEYCETILRDLGLTIDQNDKELVALMDLLGGHPLSMRIILPRLEKQNAVQVTAALHSNLHGLGTGGDGAEARLFSTLQFVQQSLPEQLRPLLVPIGMHEGYVSAAYLYAMAAEVDRDWTRAQIDGLMQALMSAGLLHDRGQAVYWLHPLLTSFLRSMKLEDFDTSDQWARAFVEVMGRLAGMLAEVELRLQRFNFQMFGQTFHRALAEAERLNMREYAAAILQTLGLFALNTRNFADAFQMFERQAHRAASSGDGVREALAYHRLGRVAEDQRHFAAARDWYRKSLEISEGLGDEPAAAVTYNQLGHIAVEQRDFSTAEGWLIKSLKIKEKFGDERAICAAYHGLGIIAQEQLDLDAAEKWYRKSLQISEKLSDEHLAVAAYYGLGTVAWGQLDFVAAEKWYGKSVQISEKLGDERGAAIMYHQLGTVARERRNFTSAERWYRRSLEIDEKFGNEHGAANTYYGLGVTAQEQRDFALAKNWYRKTLEISEKCGANHVAAGANNHLASIAQDEGGFLESGQLFIASITGFLQTNDTNNATSAANNFMMCFSEASTEDQMQLKALWTEAGLGEFPTQKEE